MPRLLLFAACEKLISSQEDNTFTIISILQGFDIPAAPPPHSPENPPLVAPVPWYGFALWEAVKEEPERFWQRIWMTGPEGTELAAAEMPIVVKGNGDKRFHRSAFKRIGFQITSPGDYLLRIAVRDGDGDFVELVERAFPVPVSVATPKPPAR